MGGKVGLAISSAMMMTGMFQWGVRQSAELENQMTSVERIMEYSKLEEEGALESPPGKRLPHFYLNSVSTEREQEGRIFASFLQAKNHLRTGHQKEKLNSSKCPSDTPPIHCLYSTTSHSKQRQRKK